MERKLLLLGLLRQQDMHGYQIFELLERGLAACMDLKKPTAYYLLNKMAEEGWITEQQIQEGNRPPRHVYSLTEQGEREFQRLLRENLSSYDGATFPGDIGVAFLNALPAQEALDLLARRRSSMLETLDQMRSVPTHAGSYQWVIQHQIHHIRSELDWLDQVVELMQSQVFEN